MAQDRRLGVILKTDGARWPDGKIPPTSGAIQIEEIPRFYPKQGSSTHSNIMGIVKAIWELFVCQARPSVPP